MATEGFQEVSDFLLERDDAIAYGRPEVIEVVRIIYATQDINSILDGES